MKFVTDQEKLVKALGVVSKAISSNNTLPVLENILLKVEGTVLTLVATNLEISISTYLEVSVEEEGAITLPAKIFTSYVSLLPPATPITVTSIEQSMVSISTARSKTKIKGIPAEDFPLIPPVDTKHTLSFERESFMDALSHVLFSTSANTTRPILSGVAFQVATHALTLASTDSFRLSEKKLEVPGLEPLEPLAMIVPAKTLTEVLRIFTRDGGESGFVHVSVGANQVQFEAKETKLISRLIEGVFPQYQQIIPAEYKVVAQFSKEELAMILRRANLFARENNYHTKVTIDPSAMELRIMTDSVTSGEEVATLPLITAEGEEMTVALNSQFFLDLLSTLDENVIELSMLDPLKAAVFRPVLEEGRDTSYLHLIMPLRG